MTQTPTVIDSITRMLNEKRDNPDDKRPLLVKMRERRDIVRDLVGELQKRSTGWTASMAREFRGSLDDGVAYLELIEARVTELEEQETREDAAARHRVELGITEPGVDARWSVSAGPEVYNDPRKVPTGPSFFKDLRNSRLGDWAAADRLNRNEARARETRAGDMTTVAGAGGQFAPPSWIIEEFVALARPARVAANLATHMDLPSGVSSVNLPKVSGGTTTAIQATQNTALSDTAATTTAVTSGISTIGGKQVVSRQLLDQAGTEFDRVVLGDLSSDYAKQLDLQYLSGSGSSGQLRGLDNGAGVGGTTFTSASPAVTSATAANSFYNKLIAAANTIQTTRFLPPDGILMHPQRWNWVLEGLDTATRPLVVPDGPIFNSVGTGGTPTAQGAAGTLLGLPVFVDPNITTTNNTNQDVVYVGRFADVFLWESELRMESFDATYADQASVLFRVLAYSALIPDRYGASVNRITGTGLLSPTL